MKKKIILPMSRTFFKYKQNDMEKALAAITEGMSVSIRALQISGDM